MLFSFFDTKAEAFGPLFEGANFDDAKRTFNTLLLSGADSLINKYPQDFILYHIGDFNKQAGVLFPLDAPSVVISGFEMLQIIKNEMKGGDGNVTRKQVKRSTKSSSDVG